MQLTTAQREKARRFFTDNQLAPPYDHELDSLAAILQYSHNPEAHTCEEDKESGLCRICHVEMTEECPGCGGIGYHKTPCSEWSGSPDPSDPDNFWIDDTTKERVNAKTGERTTA